MRVVHSSEHAAGGSWRWSVWIEGTTSDLDEIDAVDWRLGPDFPDPVRRVTDRPSKFRLSSVGWGAFPIVASLSFRGGRPALRLTYFVELGNQAPVDHGVAGSTEPTSQGLEGDDSDRLALRGSSRTGLLKAVCVGIDSYRGHELTGAVHDARAWASALRRRGFDVTLLLDAAATRQGILAALTTVISQAREGDVVVFQFAGHGTQVDDVSADEPDGIDEALCAADYQDGGLIVDDDLSSVINTLRAGVNFTFFVDCSHTGTISRVMARSSTASRPASGKPRFVPYSRRLSDAHRDYRLSLPATEEGTAPPTRVVPVGHAYFFACRSHETAYEVDGKGVFSTHATDILNTERQLTNSAFADLLNAAMLHTNQHPQLDCLDETRTLGLLHPVPDEELSRRGPAESVIPRIGLSGESATLSTSGE